MKLRMVAVYAGSPEFDSQYHIQVGAVVRAWPAFKSCQQRIRPSRLSSTAQPVQGQPELFEPSPPHPLKRKSTASDQALLCGGTGNPLPQTSAWYFSRQDLTTAANPYRSMKCVVCLLRPRRLVAPVAMKHPAAPMSCSQLPTSVQMVLQVTTKLLHGSRIVTNSCSVEIMCDDILDLCFLHPEQWSLSHSQHKLFSLKNQGPKLISSSLLRDMALASPELLHGSPHRH